MSSGIAVYPSAGAVPIGNMISNTVENVGFSIYSSDDDDDEDGYGCNTSISDSPSKIIAEAESLLLSQSPSEDDIAEFRQSLRGKLSPRDDDSLQVKEGQTNSCLISTSSKKKMKKYVTFNMELNETHEFDCNDDKCFQMETEEDCKLTDQVMDAGDLFESSESEEEEDLEKDSMQAERVKVAFGSTDVITLPSENEIQEDYAASDMKVCTADELLKEDVESLGREKSKLEEEIKLLHQEYETEMDRLRNEYETRREDYLTELEIFRSDIDKERGHYEDESMDTITEDARLRDRRGQLEVEREKLTGLEEELQRRRQQCAEQDSEINEYESYLNRRHTSLTDKEEDLKVLQEVFSEFGAVWVSSTVLDFDDNFEELEELSRALRKREKDLRSKQDKFDSEENNNRLQRHPSVQEEELCELRIKVKDLSNDLLFQKQDAESRDEERKTMERKLQTLESENKKLQQKVKHLETQLTVGIKLQESKQDSHYMRRTSVLLAQQSSENGELLSSSRIFERSNSGKSLVSSKSSGFHSQRSSDRKNEKSRDTPEEVRVDSRTNISKTCVLM